MITDLNTSIIIAVTSGFIGSLSQSALEYFFDAKIDKQIKNLKQEITVGLSTSIWSGMVFGVVAFTLAHWDTTMSAAKLNRLSIALCFAFPLSVIFNRIVLLPLLRSPLFSRKNKTNN